jgi:hypothetical protein
LAAAAIEAPRDRLSRNFRSFFLTVAMDSVPPLRRAAYDCVCKSHDVEIFELVKTFAGRFIAAVHDQRCACRSVAGPRNRSPFHQ